MATGRGQFQAELRNNHVDVISIKLAFSIRASLPLSFIVTWDCDKALRKHGLDSDSQQLPFQLDKSPT